MNSELIELTFENQTSEEIWIWNEPQAYGLEIPAGYEYKIITNDNQLRFQFEKDNLTLWLENRFGCKIMKRKIGGEWEVDIDTLDIQFPHW